MLSLKTPKIHIFFHCFARNDWEAICCELLPMVQGCSINCTLIGGKEDHQHLITVGKEYSINLTVRRFSSPEVYEHEAMLWIKENADRFPDDFTLYFHTKGAGNPSYLNTVWRLDMMYFFLLRWRSLLRRIAKSDKDISGLWWGVDENDEDFAGTQTAFFAGNFWLARNSYLAKLPDYQVLKNKFNNSRFLPERYIGFGRPNVLFINQSEVLPIKGENGIQWEITRRYSDSKLRAKLMRLIWLMRTFDIWNFRRKLGSHFSRVISGTPHVAPLKVGIVIHVFYPELFDTIIQRLITSGYREDLIITCPHSIYDEIVKRKEVLAGRFGSVEILSFENRGRDILPFLRSADIIMQYDIVCKLHTKKSDYSAELKGWSDFLIDSLVGNEQILSQHLAAFRSRRNLGIISPAWFNGYPGEKYNWGSNKERVNALIAQLNLGRPAPKKITFPAGSMFWFRPCALEPLFSKKINDSFEDEKGQLDGTTAHAVERMFHLVAERSGFVVKILH